MSCLFAVFGAFPLASRSCSSDLHWPVIFNVAFGGRRRWPVLGGGFLPFTTLAYVLLWSPGIGLDVWCITSSVSTNRERAPGMTLTNERAR